jgi:hypothetical protein
MGGSLRLGLGCSSRPPEIVKFLTKAPKSDTSQSYQGSQIYHYYTSTNAPTHEELEVLQQIIFVPLHVFLHLTDTSPIFPFYGEPDKSSIREKLQAQYEHIG